MAAAAQPTRSPAARSSGDAETAAGVRRMLEAMRLPCAIYAEHDDRTLCCNRAFRNEFAPQSAEQDRAAFLASFERFTGCPRSAEAASDPAELPREEVFAPDTGRSYAFIWSRTEFAGADARLLCALNLTDVQESMRRHGALQEQLLITSRAMSVAEIVSTLAHELNQPLAAIINFIDAGSATQAGETDERAAEALRLARTQAEHASAVIARVREFVRAREPVLDAQSVPDIVARVVAMLAPDAHKHRVRLRTEIDHRLPDVLADAVMIEQVLANLLRNAIEAMQSSPPDRRVATVSARPDAEGRVQLQVRDQGPGIDAAQQAHLFAPLYSGKAGGMGLGLSLCRSIVEFHHGSLYLDPAVRDGACFTFTLQAAEA